MLAFGALGFFAALGVEWLTIRRLRNVISIEQIREWSRTAVGVQRLGGASMATILLAGIYMMAATQFDAAWLIVAFGALVLLSVLGVALTGRRLAATGKP